MKLIKPYLKTLSFLLLLIAATTPLGAEEVPINITSQTMTVERDKKLVIFQGDVDVRKGNMTVNTDKLIVFYRENGKEVERMEAIGKVKIEQEGRVAVSEKAVFFNKEEKLILTGNPKSIEGSNSVEGERIIIYLKEGKSIVEGGSKERVKAVFVTEEDKSGDKK